MQKDLVVGVVGDQSLHQVWRENANFDLMLIYYGNIPNKHSSDCNIYIDGVSGSKWNIVSSLKERFSSLFDSYRRFLFLDDDLYINGNDINRFFDVADHYDLWLCQPSITGWITVPFAISQPMVKIRFTNWVEIMCPCFTAEALQKCWETFDLNQSNWGIAFLWSGLLGEPRDKIAIIDEVSVIHTRPVGAGENYSNNKKIEIAKKDFEHLIKHYNIDPIKIEYSRVETFWEEFDSMEYRDRFYPSTNSFQKIVTNLRNSHVSS